MVMVEEADEDLGYEASVLVIDDCFYKWLGSAVSSQSCALGVRLV